MQKNNSLFSDEYFMQLALYQAEIAMEKGEIPVGAVVVCQNTIIANQSIIQVYQNGHFNLTDIYRVENEVNEYIIQNGNGNSINEMSIGNYNTIDNQYIQNGNNNRITSFGSNSISENLKIQINGNNAAIIVISR